MDETLRWFITAFRLGLKMLEFDYRQERLSTGDTIFRPIAKVYLLRSENEWIAEYFYIDSGADYTSAEK